ncbi:YxeA family protein [Alkalihalobacillus pseudalcaliphilus]|uniref:YxeA family protein n=1 Tax=Alkalihalobacillus pseudalcaliphilus TaxID=79884 RepID=UPI00064DB4F6|nr:YxeA family protein [Alkalihalobacillus pseudalcaliphilus]KMK77699.1 hypothetical protein AB990_04380 [Alkalihalobacillus pseudalcaliphilus]
MKKAIISILILIVIIGSLYVLFRETFDRFNPFISEDYIYVEVQDEDEPKDDNGRFTYDLKGINENKETKRVVFSTSTQLEPGTFIRVLAKGMYAIEYTLISEDDMP